MTEEAKAKLLSDSYSREELALKRGVGVRRLDNLLSEAQDRLIAGHGKNKRIDKAWADAWLKKEMKKKRR